MNKNRPGNTGRAMVMVPGGTARSLPTEIERNPAELLVRVVRCPPDKTEARTRLRTRLTRLRTRCELPPVGGVRGAFAELTPVGAFRPSRFAIVRDNRARRSHS